MARPIESVEDELDLAFQTARYAYLKLRID